MTPDSELNEDPVIEEPTSEYWPEELILQGEGGSKLRPGDPGYDSRQASRMASAKISELLQQVDHLKAMAQEMREATRPPKGTMTPAQAARVSMKMARENLEKKDAKKRELLDTLKEMKLIE